MVFGPFWIKRMHRYLAYVWHFRMASDLASRLGPGLRVGCQKRIDRSHS